MPSWAQLNLVGSVLSCPNREVIKTWTRILVFQVVFHIPNWFSRKMAVYMFLHFLSNCFINGLDVNFPFKLRKWMKWKNLLWIYISFSPVFSSKFFEAKWLLVKICITSFTFVKNYIPIKINYFQHRTKHCTWKFDIHFFID